jgi:3'-phosphoadenosine 5'-phosphosulfate (PAPS) 3'-phosphatase
MLPTRKKSCGCRNIVITLIDRDSPLLGVNECNRLFSTVIAKQGTRLYSYCSFAYSALASLRVGMSGAASFQRAKKS